jgi:hypothetical protein
MALKITNLNRNCAFAIGSAPKLSEILKQLRISMRHRAPMLAGPNLEFLETWDTIHN